MLGAYVHPEGERQWAARDTEDKTMSSCPAWDTNLNSLAHSLDPNPLYQVARRLDGVTLGSQAQIKLCVGISEHPLIQTQVEGKEWDVCLQPPSLPMHSSGPTPAKKNSMSCRLVLITSSPPTHIPPPRMQGSPITPSTLINTLRHVPPRLFSTPRGMVLHPALHLKNIRKF